MVLASAALHVKNDRKREILSAFARSYLAEEAAETKFPTQCYVAFITIGRLPGAVKA